MAYQTKKKRQKEAKRIMESYAKANGLTIIWKKRK
jgi:hypothetical protein